MYSYLQADHRADYVKFLLRAPVDLCEHYKLQFEQIIAGGEEWDGPESGYHVKPLRRHQDTQWTYVYEIYGPLAQVVKYFAWDQWSPLLERMDVKFDLELTTEGVKAVRAHMEAFGASGRNVQTFNSRVRTKQGGRDAGGFGIAVGSHKSTSRLSAYKRGKEAGGVEYQLTGKPVKAASAVINMLRKAQHEPAVRQPWDELRQQLFTITVKDFEKATSMSFSELCDTLKSGTSDNLTERRLRQFERDVNVLDKAALQVVQALVQERLALDF